MKQTIVVEARITYLPGNEFWRYRGRVVFEYPAGQIHTFVTEELYGGYTAVKATLIRKVRNRIQGETDKLPSPETVMVKVKVKK